jgi:Tfp pilus assembly protein PilX
MKQRHAMPRSCRRRREAGFSLITVVVIVLMVTIVGMAALTASRSQVRAAGSSQYQLAALHEADRAIATGETWLHTGKNSIDPFKVDVTQPAGIYRIGGLGTNNPLTWTWSSSNSVAANGEASRYLIEQMAANVMPLGESQRGLIDPEGNTDCKQANVFRITSRGTGGAGASRTLQTVFSVSACS